MRIEQNKVVTFNYRLREEGGPELENNYDTVPMVYLHGHGNLLAGLEDALSGLAVGESKTITLPPEQAYGQRRENANQRIPIKHIASKHKRLLPGMLIKVSTENGLMNAKVVKPGKFMVEVDTNHPFAGKTLVFDVTITEVRDATAEEIAHRHVHGPGGHHH